MRMIKAFILVLMSFSICTAANSSMEKAYSLYNQGKMETAIELIRIMSKNILMQKHFTF